MKKSNIFENDIEIPDIVQKKADFAFSQIKESEESDMKKRTGRKLFVRSVAMVASVAVLIGAMTAVDKVHRMNREKNGGDVQDGVESTFQNLFTINVMAAELKEGEALPVSVAGQAKTWVWGYDEERNFEFSCNLPLTVTGDNMKLVSYSINKGAFQIVHPVDNNIVLKGEAVKLPGDVCKVGGGFDIETGEFVCETSTDYYKNFTLDSNNQSGDYVFINVADYLEKRTDIAKCFEGSENFTPEEECEAYNKLLEDIVITCSVEFENGTVAEKQLKLVAKTYTETDTLEGGEEYEYKAVGVFCELISDEADGESSADNNEDIAGGNKANENGFAADGKDKADVDDNKDDTDVDGDKDKEGAAGGKDKADEAGAVDGTDTAGATGNAGTNEKSEKKKETSDRVTKYGDTILVLEEKSDNIKAAVGGEHVINDVCEKEIKIDVNSMEFARWDWEPTEEDIMPNVEAAEGLRVGDTFELSFEYGDGRVYYRYTILDIRH